MQLFELFVQVFQFSIRKLFEIDQTGTRAFHTFYQLVQFQLS